jgi:hypothetical protein
MRISLSDEALADFEAATDWYLEELAFVAMDDFADHIRIIAVANHSRRPGYWAGRR